MWLNGLYLRNLLDRASRTANTAVANLGFLTSLSEDGVGFVVDRPSVTPSSSRRDCLDGDNEELSGI